MKKLALLPAILLLTSVLGCSSGDSVCGPDISDQAQTRDTDQRVTDPGFSPGCEGDPDELGGGFRGPE